MNQQKRGRKWLGSFPEEEQEEGEQEQEQEQGEEAEEEEEDGGWAHFALHDEGGARRPVGVGWGRGSALNAAPQQHPETRGRGSKMSTGS